MENAVIERIKRFIDLRGLNPTSLSKVINVPQKTVNNYLNEKRKLSFEFVCKMSSSFGLNLEWLINGSGDMEKQDNPADDNVIPISEGIMTIPKGIAEHIKALTDIISLQQQTIAELTQKRGDTVGDAKTARAGS
ncbi:MAG: helix-turn-helix domain-containing protein [Tannerella sp.]|jgi:plasmid maintenance system antidote protein VapI|nr:helix-turn-helix domain-containing protein [Tannerella sp.]